MALVTNDPAEWVCTWAALGKGEVVVVKILVPGRVI